MGHYTPQYTALVNQVTSPTENETANLVTEKMLIKQSWEARNIQMNRKIFTEIGFEDYVHSNTFRST